MDSDIVYKCRLCLNNTSKKVDIFKHDFPKMIELLTGIKVGPNDNLPKESCLDCAKDVKFCMSVRKQIIQSYKILLQELLESEHFGTSAIVKSEARQATEEDSEKIVSKKISRQKAIPKRRTRRRARTPDSTTDEEANDSSAYSDYEIPMRDTDSTEEVDNVASDDNVVEQITVINDVDPKSEGHHEAVEEVDFKSEVKSEEGSQPKEELDIETGDLKESSSNPPLSPQRLLRKRNMIAASNRILRQEKSLNERRYNNVVFVRKSANSTRQQKGVKSSDKPRKTKQRQEDETNVIWKNGKKYAACEICKREVKKHYLKHHMTTHFPEHFSCDICGVTTRNQRGLRYHKLYWHSSKLDYICDKCGKKYRSKHALDLHNKKEHGGVRDLECNICGKKFFQKMHLKRHIDGIHKKLRPHKCEYCGKDFSKRTHLVTHWRTHTNETPYGCDMCGERFKLKLSLRNHLRRAHNYEEKERVFCNICNRGFATEQGLKAHINSRVHEGEKCQFCSESFTPEYLKVHLREVHLHIDYF